MKFTDRAIASLPRPPEGRKDYWRFDSETQGWGVRVSTASKIFYYQERDGRGQLRERIGPFPALTTAEARKIVKTLAGKVAAGADLRAEKVKKKANLVQARVDDSFTFGDLITAWEEAHRSKRRSRYVKATAGGARNAFAHLLDRPAASITPEQLEGVWKSLTDLPSAAHAAGARARTLYRWALKTRRLENDPTQRTILAEKPGNRQNFLTGEEARLVWRAAGTLPAPYGQLIKLLLASAVRLREAAEAPWTEFSGDLAEWTISRERMKLNEVHAVWLPLPVREMLDKLPRFSSTDLVFTSDGHRAVTGFSDLKKRLDKALEGSGVKPFWLHDFRRSVTTWLVRGGTDPIVADRLLAHTGLLGVSSVASTYNVYKYEAERRVALERWVNFLAGEEVQTSSSSQLMLPAPESVTAPPVEVESPIVILGDFTQAMAHKDEVAARFIRKITDILTDPAVMHAVGEIRKFMAKHHNDAHPEALVILAHKAAEWSINDETVLKSSEVKTQRAQWGENARQLRDDAKRARAAAEQARSMGQEEFVREAEVEAVRLEQEALTWEQMLEAFITPDDPRCVEHRPGGASHVSSRAKGVALRLRELTEELFGREYPTWAAAFANAATGGSVTRFQLRHRLKDSASVS